MGLVLVSFVGRGQTPRDGQLASLSRGGYLRATYRFAPENGFPEATFKTSFFGSALLQRLRQTRRPVKRWLLMGTQQSLWNDLVELFPGDAQERLSDTWSKVDDGIRGAVNQGSTKLLNQDLLDEWQTLLSTEMRETEVMCRLVGAADSSESQERVCQALLGAVENGDEIVLDITHGYRHQPVIASFVVMLLRWLRGVKRVEFYYGALELKCQGDDGCTVLKLDLCQELLEASEAVATYKTTGNYMALGSSLNLSEEFSKNLKQLYHSDEMNRPDRKSPKNVSAELAAHKAGFDSIKSSVAPLLNESLSWTTKGGFAERLAHKARVAFDHEQYFKATPLLWEAILVAGCRKFNISEADRYAGRVCAEDSLYASLDPSQEILLRKIEMLRNAVVHGTQPLDAEVQAAWNDNQSFKILFEKGWNLLRSLLTT